MPGEAGHLITNLEGKTVVYLIKERGKVIILTFPLAAPLVAGTSFRTCLITGSPYRYEQANGSQYTGCHFHYKKAEYINKNTCHESA
jgi:hypothetical protein